MTPDVQPETSGRVRTLPALRWWIGGLLFASTVINYLDRQTLSVLAPYLKQEYRWSNQDFAWIVISFRAAYAVGQALAGRFIDKVGTRTGLTITVLWYSIAAMLTSLASGLRSFCVFRFILGLGEAANWPAATKAVAEWFPKRERGWAVALFDSGSSIGGAIAPFLVLTLFAHFGGWRPAFVVVGALGFLWLVAWRLLYHAPEQHPRLRSAERQMILSERDQEASAAPVSWAGLLRLRQTWGTIVARSLTDPVWFFITDWFAIYLLAKGVNLEQGLLAFWIPFIAADLGNFFGGGMSSRLIRQGWPVGRARKTIFVCGCVGMTLLIPTLFTSNVYALAALFGFSTFAYASASTMAIVLPSDLFASRSVASVSGMCGTGAGIGTIMSTFIIGIVADKYSFAPILVGASVIPLVGAVLVLILVRNTNESGRGLLLEI